MPTQSNSTWVPQSQPQNVAQGQPSAASTQAIRQSPVAPQQQSPLSQPPVPGSHAAPIQQGQPQFVQPRVNPPGNKGNPHHLGKILTIWISLSFQQQRHSQMLYPTHQKTRSLNQVVDKEWRVANQMARHDSDVNSPEVWQKTALSNHTVQDATPEDTSQQSALQRTKATYSRVKHARMVNSRWMKDAKTGSEHKIGPSFQTQTTDVSTVQVIMDPVIVQQGISTRHHLPTILLVVQV